MLAGLGGAALLAPCDQSYTGPDGEPADAGAELIARVLEVTDGDTIVVELPGGGRESVRYIGIDTPESNPDQPLECFGHEAAEANERLVGGREVLLELGPEPRDDYGRLLAFVRLPRPAGGPAPDAAGLLVNAELVRRGFARTLTIAPNDQLAPLLRGLEDAAGRAGVGLWGACSK